MELSSDIQAHQKLVMAKMAASAELQSTIENAPADEPAVIDVSVFTGMLEQRNI
ncbi:hypothetical protein N9R32_00115 [Actinomycetota bacterium]|jgi:hypothetical protein|nr:hypothetical protein [Actinomycetota bacterium]